MKQVEELIQQHGSNLALVVNMSGGKDSVRMLGKIRELFPNQKTYVVYADTGFEHVRPVSAEDWSRARSAQFGLGMAVVRNPNKTYLEMVEHRGKFPAPKYRQCTSDLKRGPIQVFLRHLPEKVLINCTGIRAEESPQRAKQKPWAFDQGMSKNGRIVWNWMPIFEEKLMEVLRWHWTHQVPLHPVYVAAYHADEHRGGYLRRFSCRVCIFSTTADLRAIHEHDPEAFYLVANLEKKIGFTMRSGESLFQIIQSEPSAQDEKEECLPCAA